MKIQNNFINTPNRQKLNPPFPKGAGGFKDENSPVLKKVYRFKYYLSLAITEIYRNQ